MVSTWVFNNVVVEQEDRSLEVMGFNLDPWFLPPELSSCQCLIYLSSIKKTYSRQVC
jgi:hypothetical protein